MQNIINFIISIKINALKFKLKYFPSDFYQFFHIPNKNLKIIHA